MANIISVRKLKVWFPIKRGIFSRTLGYVKAVDEVSFDVNEGEILGIVGESGSGKSTIARVVSGLQQPTDGAVEVNGRVSMVFQDPLGSLNPRMTIGATLEESLRCADSKETPESLLEMVGLASDAINKYPHEFSGGQRQRICIARAIAVKPRLLICDEAVSALDLSIRAQVLRLLIDLRAKLGLSMLFITHDLGVVQHIADRVIVMHRGKIEEEGPCGQILKTPKSDYTKYLLSSVPQIGKALT